MKSLSANYRHAIIVTVLKQMYIIADILQD